MCREYDVPLEPCSLSPKGCHKDTLTRTSQLQSIPEREQKLLCMRTKRNHESVNTQVCAHHFYLYIHKYSSLVTFKNCANPFGDHRRSSRGSKRVTLHIANAHPALVPGDLLCPGCYIRCSRKLSTRKNPSLEESQPQDTVSRPQTPDFESTNRVLVLAGETLTFSVLLDVIHRRPPQSHLKHPLFHRRCCTAVQE